MLVTDFIQTDVPIPTKTDTIGQVLQWMEENRCAQLPIWSEAGLEGVVNEEDLLAYPEDFVLHQVAFLWRESPQLHSYQTLWEVLPLFATWQVLPVVDDTELKGLVTDQAVYKSLAHTLQVQEPGAVMEVQIRNRDYSLTELARLIESNHLKIISVTVTGTLGDPENPLVVWIKVNQTEISGAVSTLERFGYSVKAVYGSAPIETIDQQRYDLLMKYLNI